MFYARDSGGSDQDLSIAQQQQAAGDWCREQGYILTHVFADVAKSGTSLAGRAQFLSMLDYLASGVPECGVLLYELARFSRAFDDTVYFLSDLRRRGYIVHSLSDPVPDTLDGRLFESISAWKNAKFSEDLSRLVKRGQQYIVTQHHAVLGGTPLGYKRVEIEIGRRRDGSAHIISQLAIDEAIAPLVRKAFELRADGATMTEIHAATRLRPWIKDYSYMFRNPRYNGRMIFNGVEIPDYCPAIIDDELWAAVQELMDERAKKHAFNHPRAVRSRYILSGLLKCSECGAPMVGRVLKRQKYPDYLSYCCTGHTRLSQPCSASLIRKELIEQRVIELVQESMLIPAELDAAYQLARRVAASGDSSRQAEIQRARNDLSNLEKSIARVLAAIREAGHSAALLADLASLEDQQRQAGERLAQAEAARPRTLPELDMAQVAGAIREKLVSATPAEVSQVLRGFIISVFARKPRGEELEGMITYRLPALGLDEEFVIPL